MNPWENWWELVGLMRLINNNFHMTSCDRDETAQGAGWRCTTEPHCLCGSTHMLNAVWRFTEDLGKGDQGRFRREGGDSFRLQIRRGKKCHFSPSIIIDYITTVMYENTQGILEDRRLMKRQIKKKPSKTRATSSAEKRWDVWIVQNQEN